jgi:hypothetical protein
MEGPNHGIFLFKYNGTHHEPAGGIIYFRSLSICFDGNLHGHFAGRWKLNLNICAGNV